MTNDNHSQMFLTFNDQPLESDSDMRFQFKAYSESLSKLIAFNKSKTPLVIGINGVWGSGKTTLMKSIKRCLESISGDVQDQDRFRFAQESANDEFSTIRPCKTIWFNAWKYSREEHLFSALIQQIIKQMKDDGFLNRIYSTWNDPYQPKMMVPESFINVLSQIISFGQIDIDLSKFETESRFKHYLSFYDEFQTFFDELLSWYISGSTSFQSGVISDEKGVLVIFIDDLDRCLPYKTIQVLESIKLFMDKPGLVFVVGADINNIAAAVDAHYRKWGVSNLNSNDYLEKIFQIRFDLPPKDRQAMQSFITQLPNLDKDLKEALEFIAGGIDTNPRKVKTFINHIEMQWAIIVSADLQDEMNKKSLIEWSIMKVACSEFEEYLRGLETNFERSNRLTLLREFALASQKMSEIIVDVSSSSVYKEGIPIRGFSSQEFKLIHYLWERRGEVITRSEIISNLLPSDSTFIKQNLADLVESIRRTIETDPSNPEYLKTVRDDGYIFTDSQESYIEIPELPRDLDRYKENSMLLRVITRGTYDFSPENIGLYVHLSTINGLESE